MAASARLCSPISPAPGLPFIAAFCFFAEPSLVAVGEVVMVPMCCLIVLFDFLVVPCSPSAA
jgi:hypothetical protein